MIRSKWIGLLLPAGLGFAGIALLLRVSVLDTAITFPDDLDVLIILLGLSLAIFTSLYLLVREAMERLRQQSFDLARTETLSEHRRFLNRLDHELKNPLTALRVGLAGLAMTPMEKSQQQLLAALETETLRLSEVVTNLRKLAELETLPLEAHPIDIQLLVEEVIALEGESIESSQRHFILERPEYPLKFVGDQDLLLLALHNLLDNALNYTRPGDTIRLRVIEEGDDLVVEVQDTGIGIAAAEIQLVWEELYRGKNAGEILGSGIGLALVRAIIERHYGEVKLESQIGEGTTVTVRLPLV